jgi:hypothetical protein
MKPNYVKNYSVPDPVKFSGHKVHNTLYEAKLAFATLSETDAVVVHSNIDMATKLGVGLNGSKVGAQQLGLLPEVEHQRNMKNYLVKIVANPIQSISSAKRIIKRKLNFTSSLDFLIAGGKNAERNNRYKTDKNTDIIKAHAQDYDRYLEAEMKGNALFSEQYESYAVFLDEDMVFHPDTLYLGVEPYCTEDTYYPEINRFFKEFEIKTGLDIIIAAHPRADYENRVNPFESRNIISGSTVSLVKHSSAVLAHGSTSLNFAVLYNKPVIILDSLKYPLVYRNHINAMSSALGSDIIIISEKYSTDLNQYVVDENKYAQYKEKYIKEPGTQEKFIWELFCDYLDEDLCTLSTANDSQVQNIL